MYGYNIVHIVLSQIIPGIYVFAVAATTRAGNPQGREGRGAGRKWHSRVQILSIFASIKRIGCLEFAVTVLFIRASRGYGGRGADKMRVKRGREAREKERLDIHLDVGK